AYARGYATITQVDITYEHAGVVVTLPVGYKVSISAAAPGPVVIDEPAMLMSPSPAQFAVDPNDPTTQDGALTTATIPNGSSLTFSYADEWIQGYLPAPPWWCTEEYQFTHEGVGIVLGGEVLPTALQNIIASPYHDSEAKNSQMDVWNYMKTHPTIVVGKTPLWKEIPQTAGQIISVAVSATNIAVRDDGDTIDGSPNANGAIVTDTIPAGWSVVSGSYSATPTSTKDNPDGSKTVSWTVDLPAADVTGRTGDDLSKPTPYHGMKFRYQLESPRLPAGRLALPRAEVDTNADDAIDAHSAIPVLDVLRVNNAPTALLGGPYSGVEGTPITFDASASTDVDGDSLQYRWDYTSDGAWDTGFDASAISPPITFGDDATGTVTVEVTDGELTSLASASYAIANAAPVITSLAITGAPEGSPVTITGTFMDPGWLDTHTAFVEWGTGEMDTFAVSATHDPPAATGTFTITHTYGDDFTYAGTLVLMDDDGGSVVQDLSVPVSNVAPAVGPTDVQLFVQAQICLRVAGKTWNTVHMDLYRDDVIVGSISVTRARGSPNDQARCILADVDLLASHVYRAEVTFDPAPGAKTGSNSVWVLVAPMKTPTTPGHSLLKFHHVFHVGNPATYSWKVPLTSLASKLIGGCGCGDKDDDDDHEDDHHDGCGDSDDGCGDDGRDCSGDDGCDDEAGCDGSDQSCGLDTGTARDRASSDQNSGTTGPSEGRHEFVGPNDGHEDDHKKHCGDDDRDQGCDDDREHDDDDCGETGDHDGEHDDGDCGGGIQVHLRATATDAGTDDLTFTWSFSDGTSVARTYFNNGASPDPRPSSPGVRPFVVIDTVIHSLKKSCGKQVTLTVADDDGGVTTLILTIRA
ncbi:MAG: hypothetical protein E6K16_02330, partial [Methanobacteriota archaeon]